MRNKYNNVKTKIDNIVFSSKAEGRRYNELKLMLCNGNITELVLQPKFLLQEAYRKNGKVIRKIEYVADFQYLDKDGNIVIEDVKGFVNQIYTLKKKIFEYMYDYTIIEIK